MTKRGSRLAPTRKTTFTPGSAPMLRAEWRKQNMNTLPDALRDREIVSLKHAAKTAGCDQRTFREIMASSDIPLIQLSPRKRGLLLAHFDELIASRARHALKTENA